MIDADGGGVSVVFWTLTLGWSHTHFKHAMHCWWYVATNAYRLQNSNQTATLFYVKSNCTLYKKRVFEKTIKL